MDPATRAAIEEFFTPDGEELARAVARIQELDEASTYDDATTAQLVHGFTVVVREALDGSTGEARDLYNAAAVDLFREQGRSIGSVARTFVISGAILAVALERHLHADVRAAGTEWLAGFFGAWASEIVDAAAAS